MRITILLCFMHVIVAQIEHWPINTAAVAGSTVSMTCRNNSNGSSIRWNFKKSDELGERSVFDGSRAFYGFTFDVITNKFSVDVVLTKKNIQMEYAGIYKCFIIRPDQMEVRTAQLTILATHPKCGTNTSSEDNGVLEGTYVNMWCNVSFSGDLVPIMKWSRSDGREFEGTFRNSNGYISYAISEELKAEDNGKIYSCTTYFDPINSTDALQSGVTRARNAPNYKYQWNFTTDIWYGPVNISVTPFKTMYNIYDELRCHADGNPPPTYEWKSTKLGVFSRGPNLTIGQTITRNVPQTIQCVAKIQNLTAIVEITIAASKSASETSGKQLAILFMGSMCLILLILVIGMAGNRLKDSVRPFFQRHLDDEPDIVQFAENEGGYQQPEELILENLRERPEENDIQQEVGAAGFASCLLDEPATSGSPIYAEINKPRTVSGAEENVFDRYVQPISLCPIYATVRKNRKGEEPDSNDSCLSRENDNAEVNNIQSGFIQDNQAMKLFSGEEERKQIPVRKSENTEYLDMTGFRMPSTLQTLSSKPTSSMFSMSDYASIDHTIMPPSPSNLN